jgi:hypothetical protein
MIVCCGCRHTDNGVTQGKPFRLYYANKTNNVPMSTARYKLTILPDTPIKVFRSLETLSFTASIIGGSTNEPLPQSHESVLLSDTIGLPLDPAFSITALSMIGCLRLQVLWVGG